MKNTFAITTLINCCVLGFLSITTCGAFAQNTVPPKLLAKVVTEGGFTRVPISNGVIIQTNGAVLYFYDSESLSTHEPIHIRIPLMHLSAQVLNSINKAINTLSATELRRVEPNGPICADAPSTKFYVINADRQQIQIAKRQDCNNYVMSNNILEDEYITQLLKGLNEIAYSVNALDKRNW